MPLTLASLTNKRFARSIRLLATYSPIEHDLLARNPRVS